MPAIHVCPLSRLADTATVSGARHMITLVTPGTPVTRPATIDARRHLHLSLSDIVAERDGHVLPASSHVEDLIAYVTEWDRAEPILIHCWAGVSRSTAAAFVAACALAPHMDEETIAHHLRRLSPTATPNSRIVALADDILGRQGRMALAIASIGRGADCFEGVPFRLDLADLTAS